MVHFVGAGCGAADLITVRGARLIAEADVIIYAGSLVNPQLLLDARPGCRIYNSAKMTLEEVIAVMEAAEEKGQTTVRLHTGDSSLYGAIREQIDILEEKGISYDICPGVSSMAGAAAALGAEYTPARRIPECCDYQSRGKNGSTGEGKLKELCRTRGNYGDFSVCGSG